MAERLDPVGTSNDAAERLGHDDGSSARPHTQDGRLTRDDVDHAPIVDGTDPLSDDAIDRRRGRRSVTPQLAVFVVLALVFAYLLVSDVVHGDRGKAALGLVVLAICAQAIRRELRERR